MSYTGHSLGLSYPSAEIQSVYSLAPTDWATGHLLRESYCRNAADWVTFLVGAPGTVPKGMEKRQEELKTKGIIETTLATSWLRSVRITIVVLRRFAVTQALVKDHGLLVGDHKAPFSKATTPGCKWGRYSFPWIAPPYP